MNVIRKIILAIAILVTFTIIAELFLSIVFYFRHKKVSFLINRFVSAPETKRDAMESITIYEIHWDFENERMKPGKYVTKDGIEYTVNSEGFRGKEFDPVNKSKYRIICFGGSSTLGLGSPSDSTYPTILEQLLIEDRIDAEVLNFGLSSKSLNYIEKLLFQEAIKYKPELITIYSNRNTALYDSSSPYYRTGEIVKGRLAYRLHNLHNSLYENLMIYRAMFCIYRKLALPLDVANIQIGKQKINEAYFRSEYLKKLERIILAGELNGFHVCLIKQPLYLNPPIQLEIKNYSINELIKMINEKNNNIYTSKAYPGNNDMTKYWILTNAILNRQIDNLKQKHKQIIVVDPLDNFLRKNINQDELFFDYVHLTPQGNKLLAEIIADSITPVIVSDLKVGEE